MKKISKKNLPVLFPALFILICSLLIPVPSGRALEVGGAGGTPLVETGTALVSGTNVAVEGSVNPNGQPTSYYVEWGPTGGFGPSTGSFSVGNGALPVAVNAELGVLEANTCFNFRIVATNDSGTTFGVAETFCTEPDSSGPHSHFAASVSCFINAASPGTDK